MSDPWQFTKAKLKEELTAHGIPLPPASAKKEIFVDLYKTEIIGDKETESELSEKETEIKSINSKRYKQTKLKVQRIDTQNTSGTAEKEGNEMSVTTPINELSDLELADELKSYGVTPGPIMASTRKVYEKKLLKLRLGGGDVTSKEKKNLEESFDYQEYDEVPDDEESLPPSPPKLRQTPPRKQKPTVDNSLKRRPIASKNEDSSSQPQSSQENKEGSKQQSKGIPLLVKLLVFLGALFLVYLVYINMEPGSKIPKSISSSSG